MYIFHMGVSVFNLLTQRSTKPLWCSSVRSVASLISTSTVEVHLVTNDATAFLNSHWWSGSASSLPSSPAGSDLQETRRPPSTLSMGGGTAAAAGAPLRGVCRKDPSERLGPNYI